MKILFLDIESAPNTGHVWSLWKQNISLNQLLESSYVLCWAAKWLGEKKVMFDSVYKSTPTEMLEGIHNLLDEADAVIHWNGSKFDIPTLNKEFLLYGFPPPAPYKQMDLLKTSRSKFKFVSHRLDYVAKALGVGEKEKHEGHELWIKCMNYEAKAWKTMEEYNKNDVVILEKVYEKFKPWIGTGHVNYNLIDSHSSPVCPTCGGKHHQKRGFHHTNSCTYQRYQCNGCKGWFRAAQAEKKPVSEKVVGL